MGTVRMRILRCLESGGRTALEISQLVGIKEKEVYEHLPHIEKSVKARGELLKTTPCRCLACGFIFKDRKKHRAPGRCPLCKEERISAAVFEIVRNSGQNLKKR